MSEGTPSDGGFALQPEFSTEILQRSYQMGEVLSRVRRLGIGANSNSLKVNAIDETSRQTGSRFGGVQVFHANEADTATAKKPKFRQMELNLHKLLGIWYLTDELSQDTTALSAVAQQAFSEEITFTLENVIFNGNGTGQGLGFHPYRTALGVAAPRDQPGLLQHLQVLGDRRLAHGERRGQLADRGLAGGQPRQDGAPGRVGQGGEGGVEPRGRSITHQFHN